MNKDKLTKAQSYMNPSAQSLDQSVVNLFDTRYLYMSYFEMLDNYNII